MDNVTHTLIGIAVAECVVNTKQREKMRLPLWVASGLANNLPDLDVLFSAFRRADKLDYLLHHRGYTHTLLLAPVQSLLLLVGIRLFTKKLSREQMFLVFLGPLLHVFADSWNSYGVHPFWPLNNQWYYGDLIFIVEPRLWAILLPMVMRRCSSLAGKTFSFLLLLFLNAVCWLHPLVIWQVSLAISLACLLNLGVQIKLQDTKQKLLGTCIAFAAVFLIFGISVQTLKSSFTGKGQEIAVLMHPGNPFCATVLEAGIQNSEYVASAFTAAAWPGIVSATSCPQQMKMNLGPSEAQPTAALLPLGTFRGSISSLKQILKSCRARAFLRFARIPFWRVNNDSAVMGDLRFARDNNPSFAELVFSPEDKCPNFEPPWEGRFYSSGI